MKQSLDLEAKAARRAGRSALGRVRAAWDGLSVNAKLGVGAGLTFAAGFILAKVTGRGAPAVAVSVSPGSPAPVSPPAPSPSPGATLTVQTGSKLAGTLRDGPGTNHRPIGYLPNGTIVHVKGSNDSASDPWYRVQPPTGPAGWMSGRILT